MNSDLPNSMRCIESASPGAPDVLRLAERPVPNVQTGEVLIRVAAAGVNGPDIYQRLGLYPPPPGVTDILGLEISGTVAAVGDDVSEWSVGDEVCALVTGGGYAEYCPAPAVQCLPIPGGVALADAGGLPETFFTVWTNVFERAALKPGESLLVHGGAGGIGSTAIHIASALGHRVFTTATGEANCRRLAEIGAERVIDYTCEDFVAVIKEMTGKRGVDVILDIIGGDYVARNLACLARDGRLANIAFRHGSKVNIDLMPLMLKRLTITGSTLRVQSVERKAEIARAVKTTVWPLIETGKIKPLIHTTLPLADAAEGHRIMEAGGHLGKILLTP